MKIGEVAGLSKPLARLVQVVSEGVGAVYRHYLVGSAADARADALCRISEVLREARDPRTKAVVHPGGIGETWQKPEDRTLLLEAHPLEARTASRTDYQERRRQYHLEAVIAHAASQLSHVTQVPEPKPDPDWITRFFVSAQEIGSVEMQNLWGRMLAGEIKRPGSFSLRTLDFVRNLTRPEAEIFEKLGRIALTGGLYTGVPIIPIHDKKWLETQKGILPGDMFVLGELGVVFPSDLTYHAFKDETQTELGLFSDHHVLVVKRGAINHQVQLPIWKFTTIGAELLSLVEKPLDMDYLEHVGRFFVRQRGEAVIAKITGGSSDGGVTYSALARVLL